DPAWLHRRITGAVSAKTCNRAGWFPRRRPFCRWFGGDISGAICITLLAYFYYRRINRCHLAPDVVRLGSNFYFLTDRRTSDHERDLFATDRRSAVIYGARASRLSHSGSVDAKEGRGAGLAFLQRRLRAALSLTPAFRPVIFRVR